MAKRKGKRKSTGKRKSQHKRKNPKRVAAGKRAWRKRHGKGGKSAKKAYASQQRGLYKASTRDFENLKMKAILRGMSPSQAETHASKVLSRLHRAQAGQRGAHVAAVARQHASEAAAKQWSAFGDVFRKIGKEEARRAAL